MPHLGDDHPRLSQDNHPATLDDEGTVIELIVLACLHAAPSTCNEYHLANGYGLQSCMLASAPTATRWRSDHPAYDVRRMICRPQEVKA